MKITMVDPIIAAMVLLGIGPLTGPLLAVPTNWVYEAVDPEKTGGDTAAVLDEQDYAHIVHGHDALYYDWEDAAAWHSETVDAASVPDSISMVLDGAGQPVVVFVDELTRQLKYAKRDADGWVVAVIAGDAGTAVLCLDAAGWPQVCYSAGSYASLELRHMSRDASGWHERTVGTWNEARVLGLALAVGTDGLLHVACTIDDSAAGTPVFHGWWDGQTWQTAQVALYPELLTIPLQFDPTGRLHVVYQNDGQPASTYMLWTRGTYQSAQLEGAYYIRGMLVSRAGVPHVFCQRDALTHWTNRDGTWRETVIDPGRPLYGVAMTLDGADWPHLLCRLRYGSGEDTTSVLTRAWQDDQGWQTREETTSRPGLANLDATSGTTLMLTRDDQLRLVHNLGRNQSGVNIGGTVISSRDDTGWQSRVLAGPALTIWELQLALDANGNPHIAYSGDTVTGFRYAWRDAAGWHSTPIEGARQAGVERQCDLALDHEGRPHIGYQRGVTNPFIGDGMGYARLTDGGWEHMVVNTNRIYELALALDAQDHPHFLAREYVESTGSKRLVHDWRDGAGWHQETVASLDFSPSSGGYEVYPAIAVDQAGGLHICYYANNLGNTLEYGYRTETGWHLTTADANGASVGVMSALVVDDQGDPHIVYEAGIPYELRYAHKTATGWDIMTVDAKQSRRPSLCLGPDGRPRITYYTDEGDGLVAQTFRYARLLESGWERVDLETDWATSSLAVDAQGRTHIAYGGARDNLAYLWPPTAFHRIDWSEVPSPQQTGAEMSVTLTARNADGEIRTEFTDSVMLSGYAPGPVSTNVAVGAGADSWGYPLHTRYHDARTQVIYPAGELGVSCTITSLALEVVTPPGQVLQNWTIRMGHTGLNEYPEPPAWDSGGWTVVYQGEEPAGAPGWRTFEFTTPFEYNGTDNLLIDLSFNNASYSSEGQCRSTVTEVYRSITYATDSAYGDPLDWSGVSPAPVRSQTVPNLVLGAIVVGSVPVAVSLGNAGPFVDGVWTGTVSVLEPASNLVLLADDGAGHGGETFPFDVLVGSFPIILTDDGSFGLGDGHFGFNLQAEEGRAVVVEVSTDLLGWLPLQTNTMGSGAIYFSDSESPTYPHRFYRLLLP